MKNDSENGYFYAQEAYAGYLMKKGNRKQALYWYEKAANNPDADYEKYSAYVVGLDYAFVRKLKDYPLAFKYLSQSRYPDGKCAIAVFYEMGLGVKKDLSKAKEIIKFTEKLSKKALPDRCVAVYEFSNLANVQINEHKLDKDAVYAKLEKKIFKTCKTKSNACTR